MTDEAPDPTNTGAPPPAAAQGAPDPAAAQGAPDPTAAPGAPRTGRQPPTEREPVIRAVCMPRDTNPSGDIFGGWLMSQMDLAAGTIATLYARGRCATIAVDAMEFHRPVHVGDEVSMYARLLSVGRTSMKIHVEAYRRPRTSEARELVTEAEFVYVALDEHGRKRPLPAAASEAAAASR